MKKKLIVLSLSLAFIGTFAFNQLTAQLTSDKQCKIETFSCGLFKVPRQICHENGPGLSCSSCGDSTTCSQANEQ